VPESLDAEDSMPPSPCASAPVSVSSTSEATDESVTPESLPVDPPPLLLLHATAPAALHVSTETNTNH
jgi:hypothetical protein